MMNKYKIIYGLILLTTMISIVSSCKDASSTVPTQTMDSTASYETDLQTPLFTGTVVPPDTDPPATSMPTTEPPKTEPPVTNPPETTPPVTIEPPETTPPWPDRRDFTSAATISIQNQMTCYTKWDPYRDGLGFLHNDYHIRVYKDYGRLENELTTEYGWYDYDFSKDGLPSVREACEIYDEEWFEEHALVVAWFGFEFGFFSSDQEKIPAQGDDVIFTMNPAAREVGITVEDDLYVLIDHPYPENLTEEAVKAMRPETEDLRYVVLIEISQEELINYDEKESGRYFPQLGGYHL